MQSLFLRPLLSLVTSLQSGATWPPLLRLLLPRIGAGGLLLLLPSIAFAQSPAAPNTPAPPDKPILRIETGMHTAVINRISVDAANRYLVTASDDKTVRVWDAKTGAPLAVLRPPQGDGDEGKLYAVALSPDGSTVACGGWTWGKTDCVYLFDRATGRLTRRLTGLPNVIHHLAFSPDGRLLAAALGGSGGVHLWRTGDGSPAGQDSDYGDGSYGVAFSPDGAKLAATCWDGSVRLYALADGGGLTLTAKSRVAGGKQPFGVAFSPDSAKLAVGFNAAPQVAVVSAAGLSPLYTPDATGLGNGDVSSVAWSVDGQTLYAGGACYNSAYAFLIRRWADGGKGAATDLPAAANTIFDIQPRKAGGVFFGAGDPAFGAFNGADKRVLFQGPAVADLRFSGDSLSTFGVSHDGGTVRFEYQDSGKRPAAFALAARALTPGPGDAALAAPVTTADGLNMQGWEGTAAPTLNGQAIKLDPYERSRSLAIAPDHGSFLLGTNWCLCLFSKDGTQKWSVPVPGVAWAVNVSGDGKAAVAAFGDGTIRWYRMTDGQEMLAFFPHADRKRWVVWTPSGYYDCSPGGEDLIGWHVNHGADQAADFFPASRFRDTYYRPDVVSRILQTQDEQTALSQANDAAGRKAQAADIQKTLPPVVAIVSPDNNAGADTDKLTLHYILRTPSGEPVTEVHVLVDGRPVQTESRLSVVSVGGTTRTLTVSLPPRDCLVSVVAFNQFGAGEPASVHIHWVGTAKAIALASDAANGAEPEFTIQPTLYVLAVGIGQYDDPTLHLTYPPKDAQDFLKAMQAQKGRLYKDVVVYKDKALTDGDATKDAIEDGLDWLQKQTTSNDVAMIFLSGHGSNDANGKYFFLPVGFNRGHIKSTGLPWTELVSTVQAVAGKVILFNDSCHSGNVLGGDLKGLPDTTGAINELISAENGAVVFAASTGSEFAREDPAWGNGAFTKALVEGIGGSADYNHSGRITVNMLSLYVSERVKKLTDGAQHPTADKPPTVRDFPLALDEGK